MPALRFLGGPSTGPAWLCTVQVPFPTPEAVQSVTITEASHHEGTWAVTVKKGPHSYRFEFAGESEIRDIQAWVDDSPVSQITFASSHLLEKVE